jgi:hypothetical protein
MAMVCRQNLKNLAPERKPQVRYQVLCGVTGWPEASASKSAHHSHSQGLTRSPPTAQVIGLQDRTLFYYLREQGKTRSLLLIVYNQTRERVDYDHAIFFFDKQGVLTDFSYSEEAIARKK